MEIRERILGCLLGQAIADSIGAAFESQTADWLHRRFEDCHAMFHYSADAPRCYTDDTEMALALADYLADHEQIDSLELMRYFSRWYEAGRGYGRGTRALVDAYRTDLAMYEHLVEHYFPSGSWGNGAAMRAAPIGLKFSQDAQLAWSQAKASAWPTHRNALGVEGSQLIALATVAAINQVYISPQSLSEYCLPFAQTRVFENQLQALASVNSPADLAQFGNGIEAHASVVTAIACFGLFPTDFKEAVSQAIWLGGDTDTIAAMTGALVGAFVGSEGLDLELSRQLEPNTSIMPKLQTLTDRLANAIG